MQTELTAQQRAAFERELESCANSPRWAIYWATLTESSLESPTESTEEIRRAGLYEPVHQKLFSDELSACVSAPRWFVMFAQLDENDDLLTNMRCLGLPKHNVLHMAIERMAYQALAEGYAWTRNMPHDEALHRRIAERVFDALESRVDVGTRVPRVVRQERIMDRVQGMFGKAPVFCNGRLIDDEIRRQ